MSGNPSLKTFYKGKRVLVTGHTGFKGSWLCLGLLEMGCDVTGYGLTAEDNPDSLYKLSGLDTRIRSFIADIRDFAVLQRWINDNQPQIVFHMAAQSLVLPSYHDPINTYSTNIMGTVNLLEAVRHSRCVASMVNVTTDKCYENDESAVAFRETDPLGGYDPYSSSKAAAEIISASYRRSYLADAGIAMATARAGNVIGGGDFSRHRLVPDIVRAARSGAAVNLRHPESIRPWQFVLDVLHGYLLLGKALYEIGSAYAEAFNFGPDEAGMTVRALADRLAAAIGNPPVITCTANAAATHEATSLFLDSSKAKSALNWRPLITPHQAIDLTASWYARYLDSSNSIAEFTTEQLSAYMKLAAA